MEEEFLQVRDVRENDVGQLDTQKSDFVSLRGSNKGERERERQVSIMRFMCCLKAQFGKWEIPPTFVVHLL